MGEVGGAKKRQGSIRFRLIQIKAGYVTTGGSTMRMGRWDESGEQGREIGNEKTKERGEIYQIEVSMNQSWLCCYWSVEHNQRLNSYQ